MDEEQHCSRHFLGTQANLLRNLPFAPPGNPNEDGVTRKHRLMAVADWHEDSQVQSLHGTSDSATRHSPTVLSESTMSKVSASHAA